MEWIDEARRNAVEESEHIRRGGVQGTPHQSGIVSELDRILPEDVKMRALAIGNELILPYEDALTAIATATEHRMAVLGLDSGEVVDDGFRVVGCTGYDRDIDFTGDWNVYVAAINAEAERWIKEHRLGKNHGYTLTSTSQEEFSGMKL
jgi:hypothetical protein